MDWGLVWQIHRYCQSVCAQSSTAEITKVAIQSVWPVGAWQEEGEGRRISHVPGPGPDWRWPMPTLQAPVPGAILNLTVICAESSAEARCTQELSPVISYGSWLNDSSVGWQVLWQKCRGGTSKPEQKVRGHDPQLCRRTEPWRSGRRGCRSAEEGLLKQSGRSGNVTLSSAELSPERSGYKGGETPGRKHGSEAQKGHIDDFMLITDKLHQ